MDLVTRRLKTATALAGPLLFVERATRARLGELVRLQVPGLPERRGQVIELDESRAVVQVLEATQGLAPDATEVILGGEVATLGVSRTMLGRQFDGSGRPLDDLPPLYAEARLPIHGAPLNVTRRAKPAEFIETGVSAIDGLNTLVRGQKLPIFSAAGLPGARLAADIVCQARVGGGEPFHVVFGAIGAPHRDCEMFLQRFAEAGILERTVVFLNRADDPPIERLMTPRCALTAAEHLAFEHGSHVLVVLTDMTSYCDALREIGLARGEIPGRRGYPGYMYTDLATIYERAGRIVGRPGSITQLPVLTVPEDDLTHPIPDLTGYVTEGQIVLSRDLSRKGIDPPIDVLPSLSRLMNLGIGAGRTREDHRDWADQLYALYARSRDVRRMAAIVGAANLAAEERQLLEFGDRFEHELIHQTGFRSLLDTLAVGWQLMSMLPAQSLLRIRREHLERHGKHCDDTKRPLGSADAAPPGEPGRPPSALEARGAGERVLPADAGSAGGPRPPG